MRSLDRLFKSRLNGTGLKPLVQYIKDLFSNNEQGVWHDPSDLSTLYQDAAGTIPVTAVEQPVGLMLDKSKGLVLGPELVPLPLSFYSGWSPITATVDSAVTFTTTGAGGVAFPITAGKTYRITISGRTTASSTLVAFRNPSGGLTTTLINSVSGTVTATALSTESQLYIRNSGAGTTTINSISVRELPGNHASQTTATSRPVLSARVNLLTKTEDFAHSNWPAAYAYLHESAEAPDGTLTATKITGTDTAAAASRAVTVNSTALDLVWFFKSGNFIPQFSVRNNTTATFLIQINGNSVSGSNQYGTWEITSVGSSGWKRVRVSVTSGISIGNAVNWYYGATGQIASGLFWYMWHPDVRPANSGTNLPVYQRVNTSADYDTAGFPYYLKFELDDFLVTPSINFTGTDKMMVCAGVNALGLSATTIGMVVNHNSTGANAFSLQAPGVAAGVVQFVSSGTSGGHYPSESSLASPLVAVLTGVSDLAAPASALRRNGVIKQTVTTATGGGTFANQPLFIGSQSGGTLRRFSGHLYGLIIRGAATSDSQIKSVERYVNTKTRAYTT